LNTIFGRSKEHLVAFVAIAFISMLARRFGTTGQVLSSNPASTVRDPRYVVKAGKTPMLDGNDLRGLLGAIPTETGQKWPSGS
jgi:hypothetical protein